MTRELLGLLPFAILTAVLIWGAIVVVTIFGS